MRTSNNIVKIEEYFSSIKPEPNTRFLKWSFGKSMSKSDLRFGYVMKLVEYAGDSSHGEETHIEWQYNGQPCTGVYQPVTGVLVLSFHLKDATTVMTYKINDRNSLAVCVCEVGQETPSVQLGNMLRVDLSHYASIDDITADERGESHMETSR